jgi:hypothetical protein
MSPAWSTTGCSLRTGCEAMLIPGSRWWRRIAPFKKERWPSQCKRGIPNCLPSSARRWRNFRPMARWNRSPRSGASGSAESSTAGNGVCRPAPSLPQCAADVVGASSLEQPSAPQFQHDPHTDLHAGAAGHRPRAPFSADQCPLRRDRLAISATEATSPDPEVSDGSITLSHLHDDRILLCCVDGHLVRPTFVCAAERTCHRADFSGHLGPDITGFPWDWTHGNSEGCNAPMR